MIKAWSDAAWKDFEYWAKQGIKTFFNREGFRPHNYRLFPTEDLSRPL